MLRGPAGVMASDQVPSAAVTTRPASVHDFQLGALPYSAICCPASPLPSASTSRPERVTRGAPAVALAIGAAPMVRLETVAGVIRGVTAERRLRPLSLIADTMKAYWMPLVRPEMVAVVASGPAVVVTPPGVRVTTNPASGVAPVNTGRVQRTVADLSPRAATTLPGTSGTVWLITAPEEPEAAPAPAAFTVFTVNL